MAVESIQRRIAPNCRKMPRHPAGVKKKSRKRPVEQIDLPIQRSALLGVVADVAGVGERHRAVMNLLLDANSCVRAKKRFQESVSLARTADARLQRPASEAVLDSGLQADDPEIGGHQDSTTSEPALDVRIAGDCAANEAWHEDPQADAYDLYQATQADLGVHEAAHINHADSVLRVEDVDSHELLYIARLLREDPQFDCISLLACLSLSAIDITLQVPAEECRQSAARSRRDACALPQVVVRGVHEVVSGCTWLRRCRFEVLGIPRCIHSDTRDAEWKQQRRESVRPIRTALLMGHHPRLGRRSPLKQLPAEVMLLLMEKAAPMKFDLRLQL